MGAKSQRNGKKIVAVIPIVLFHDRALLQEKDWAYGTECTIAYVDEEDLVTEDDELKMQKDLDKTVVLETIPLIEALNKPNNQGFFIT
tara:strand:+ start:5632 stop:5895 length:264 start_codon:yes stop_codon:yes gene_type:complete